MSPKYAWVCHLCNSENAAGSSNCPKCGFSAVASPVQVDAARAELGLHPPGKIEVAAREDLVVGDAPLPVKALQVLLAVVLIVGAFIARFGGPVESVVGALVVGVALLGIMLVNWAWKGKAHV